MNASLCIACGARMLWVRLKSGKHTCVDFDPSEKGNIIIAFGTGEGEYLNPAAVGLLHERRREAGEPPPALYLSHFATCPQAERFRRPRRS